MGRKGRIYSRSTKTVGSDKFPLGTLAARRRELREEYIGNTSIYIAEQKKLKRLKEKVVI